MKRTLLSISVLSAIALTAPAAFSAQVMANESVEGTCLFNYSDENQDYDSVINNGRVIDPECGFDGIRNVGIRDGHIVAITTKPIQSDDALNANGMVVTAGFIDTHTHSSNKYNIKMAMMDGVTTAMDFEWGAVNVGQWYAREEGKWPINYGTCVSHEGARMMVMDGLKIDGPIDALNAFDLRALSSKDDGIEDWSVTVANKAQINQISKILDDNLKDGALCVGTTIGYAKNGVSTYEMFEVQRSAANYGRATATHSRFHTSTLPPAEAGLGFAEAFTNAATLNAPLLYTHNNDYGWWEIEEKLKLARAQGYNMWSEYYPYKAGSTSIGSVMFRPEILKDMLGFKYEEIIYDPSLDKFLSEEEYKEIVAKDSGRTIIAFNPNRAEWLPKWLEQEHMTVASDGMWSTDKSQNWDTDPSEYLGHPRTSGSHTKALRLAREAGIPLMHTLKQLSYWSATHLEETGLEFMNKRGRIQLGMAADIVIFDADNVTEGSSYKAGEAGLPPIGLPHVMVNGEYVKRDGKALNGKPGLPVRYNVEDEGRHKPITVEQIK